MRYCPRCGTTTSQNACPHDGTPTVRQMTSGQATVAVGDVIGGRYRVLGELGSGGFGTVFDSVHVTTGHPVAVKVLKAGSGAEGQEMARRFFQEAATTSRLTHPNTVRVFDFGQTDSGELFLAMERLSGDTLQTALNRVREQGETLGESQSVDVGTAVLRSLAEAHALGLVHRDMKPANIFLHQMAGGEAIVKVLDFGIVKTHDATMTQAGKALGTPTHMSPEQAMGRDVDGRSDLYSLGVVLYECLTGTVLFDAESPLAIVMRHVTEDAEPIALRAPGRVRPALAAAVEKVLAKKPEDRYQTANDFRIALESSMGVKTGATASYHVPNGMNARGETPAKAEREQTPAPTPRVAIAARVPIDDRRLAGETVASGVPQFDDGDGGFMQIGEAIGGGHDEEDMGSKVPIAPRFEPTRPQLAQARPDPLVVDDLLDGRDLGQSLSRLAQLGLGGLSGASPAGSWGAGMAGQLTRPLMPVVQPPRRQIESLYIGADMQHVVYADPNHHLHLSNLGELGAQPVSVLDLVDVIDIGAHDNLVEGLAATPDGRLVVSASIDGVVRLWDVASGRLLHEVVLDASPSAVAIASDGKLLVVGCGDGAVHLYELPDMLLRRVLRGHREAVTAVACAGSKRLVVTASEDGVVRTWDPVGGGARLTARAHEGSVGSVAVNALGQMVASGGWDGKLHVWYGRTGDTALEIKAHDDIIAGVAVDRGGNLVATAGDDRVVRVFHILTGELRAERRDFRTGVKLVRFADEGNLVVAGAWDGTFRKLTW